jgi:sugar-binding cellulase-like protein
MRSKISKPFAIAMWDFSWLERRWPGAGYEDWDEALGQLVERGYDAVRIDAYPHLVSADPFKTWTILPVWDQMNWGAQSPIRLRVLPALTEFIAKAAAHGIIVALSTWYRQDRDDLRLQIATPADQARIWIDTLRPIEQAGLLDQILYVDLCNEFPIPIWTPYFYGGEKTAEVSRAAPRATNWMANSIALVRAAYPTIDYTFSFCTQYKDWKAQDVSMLDFLEPHIWMAHRETSDYYDKIDYHHELFDPSGMNKLVERGETEYRTRQAHYDDKLTAEIDNVAAWSRACGKPLVTTECWALVDYKDWPGLDWGWIKDLTALGLEHAAKQGRWVGMATSNFCGPQFLGMWRDVAWHKRLTDLIKNAPIDPELRRQP